MKRSYSQEILIISVLALTVTILWIYLSIHFALQKSEKPILSPAETSVLVPKLDEDVFKELKERKI